jgi:hypothetical protein
MEARWDFCGFNSARAERARGIKRRARRRHPPVIRRGSDATQRIALHCAGIRQGTRPSRPRGRTAPPVLLNKQRERLGYQILHYKRRFKEAAFRQQSTPCRTNFHRYLTGYARWPWPSAAAWRATTTVTAIPSLTYGRPAIGGIRSREAQRASVGDRTQVGGRGRSSNSVAQPFRYLLATLRQGYTPMVNSIYNELRREDVWLER